MELLFSVGKKDLIRQTFRSGGKGGQNQNKVESGVRFIHEPSGSRGESRAFRTQLQNEREAFVHLANSKEFKSWHKLEVAKRLNQPRRETGEEIKLRVDKMVDEGLLNGQIKVEEM